MEGISFKRLFFRLYDRKVADGTVTFSQLGISKLDFTKLCTDEKFAFDEETILRISKVMKLTEEEEEELLAAAGR